MHIQETPNLKVVLFITVILALTGSAWAADKNAELKKGFPQPEIPQPQGFCGYCHILTYPKIIEKSYNTWKIGKHNKVGCVECHYPPSRLVEENPTIKASIEAKGENIHIPSVPPGHFSYVKLDGETINKNPRITNSNCTTTNCHGNPDDKFKTKKIKFTEKVPFVHEPHLTKKNQIEGMQVNCTTCHQHESDVKHFQVSEASCHLCHFTNTTFNRGRAKCELCHGLPEKPIQASSNSDQKPITHQMLVAAGVSCGSCHFDLIQGSREAKIEPFFEGNLLKTAIVLNAGRIKEENCAGCHDQAKYIQKTNDKKLMHEHHVTKKNARCFDCHQPILHRKSDVNGSLPDDCTACHKEPHRYQRLLVAGLKRDAIPALPDPMFKARSNCLACHIELEVTHKGQTTMLASAKTCVQCHNKDYEKMLGLWKREVGQEIEKAEKLEKEALEILAKYKSELSQQKRSDADAILKEGRENLDIVRFGNGVHNAKYAIALLDAAIASFEDMIGYIEGRDMGGGEIKE